MLLDILFVYVCVCIYTHRYMYIYTHVYVYMYTSIHTHTQIVTLFIYTKICYKRMLSALLFCLGVDLAPLPHPQFEHPVPIRRCRLSDGVLCTSQKPCWLRWPVFDALPTSSALQWAQHQRNPEPESWLGA